MGQWINGSVGQLHYTFDNVHFTFDKYVVGLEEEALEKRPEISRFPTNPPLSSIRISKNGLI
jgi:hypothetical protein